MTTPTRQQVADYLARYQKWRQGEDERTMEEAGIYPSELGRMIDDAILFLTMPEETEAPQASILSAAAPDLYESLNALIGVTQHLGPCPATLDAARAALAKARGESE